MADPDHEVAVIGAGPGGIAAAHQLLKKGITDFVILERGDDFGGSWRDNHYPGLEVDIPALWYHCLSRPTPTGPDCSRLAGRCIATSATPRADWDSMTTCGPTQRWYSRNGMSAPSCGGCTSGTGRSSGRAS